MSNEGLTLDEAQSYYDTASGFVSAANQSIEHVMTLADAEEIVNANPELYDVDYVQPQQAYPGEFGVGKGYTNQEDYGLGTEAMNPTTPGYFGFDQALDLQAPYSPLQQGSFSYQDQSAYDNSTVQAPFDTNDPRTPSHTHTAQTPFLAQTPYMAQTPYVPQNTYISQTPYVPQEQFAGADPTITYGATDDIMADANSFFSSTDDVSFEDQAETADVDNSAKVPAQPSPRKKAAPEKKPARKRASLAKAKQTTENVDNGGDAPDAKPILKRTSRTKAKQPANNDEFDVDVPEAKPTRKRTTRATAKQAAQNDDLDGDGVTAVTKPTRTRLSRGKVKQTLDKAFIEDDDDDSEDAYPRVKKDADADTKPSAVKGGKGVSTTVTPAKRKRATSVKNAKGEDRTRKTPKNGKAENRAIPDKYEDCTEADKALLDMRDAGLPWKQIRETYQTLGGTKYGDSTLPNRYERMKDKFVHMREEDHIRLFDAKKSIEADFESKKWGMIAADIVANGGETYTMEVLQRKFRLLMLKEGFTVDEGLATKDPDFVIGGGGKDAQEGAEREHEVEDDGDEEFMP